MNRRTFLTRLSTGIVGAAVITHVPVKWLPAPVKRYAALEYLRNHFNAYKGLPGGMVIHPYLYEEAENEMVANLKLNGDIGILYHGGWLIQHFLFKGVPVAYDKSFVNEDPRKVRMLNDDEWKRYVGARLGPFGDARPL